MAELTLNNVGNMLNSREKLDVVAGAFKRKFLEYPNGNPMPQARIMAKVAEGFKEHVNYAVQRVARHDDWVGYGELRATNFDNLAAHSLLLAEHYFFNISLIDEIDETILSYLLLNVLYLYNSTNTKDGSADFAAGALG